MLSHTLIPISKIVTQKEIKEGKERLSQRTTLECLKTGSDGSIPPIALPKFKSSNASCFSNRVYFALREVLGVYFF